NYGPVYSSDGQVIYFISTRRAPAITLHVRNLWKIPADGSTDPAVHYFTRSDEGNPSSLPDGRTLLSSSLGFPSEMLNRLEEESYQRLVAENEDLLLPLDEVQLRSKANDERRQLEFFEGVMSHIYTYRP
ncbi:MAG: Tol biopolymer transport system component, partial [Candidatus Krumholzibacteriia bacterium]